MNPVETANAVPNVEENLKMDDVLANLQAVDKPISIFKRDMPPASTANFMKEWSDLAKNIALGLAIFWYGAKEVVKPDVNWVKMGFVILLTTLVLVPALLRPIVLYVKPGIRKPTILLIFGAALMAIFGAAVYFVR